MKKKFKVIGLFLCAFFVATSVIFSGDSNKIFANVTKDSANNNMVAAANTENYVPKKDYSSNLVANYKMDETSGTDCKDSSGNGNNGTYNGTTSVNDNDGNYRSFNGTSDYINFNKEIIPSGAVSIQFEMKLGSNDNPAVGSYPPVFLNFDPSPGKKNGIGCNITNNLLYFTIAHNDSYTPIYYANSDIFNGNWHKVLFTWDGTTNTNGVKLYVDDMSTPKSQITAPVSASSIKADNSLSIGKHNCGGYFKGSLKNLQIYNDVTEYNSISTGIKLSKKTDSIEEGKTDKLTAAVTPDNTTNKAVKWKSSDINIAKVDENTGEITAIKEGTVTITATTQDGSNLSDSCTVTVTKAKTPMPTTTGNRATLTINMANGSTKQYDLSQSELNDFLKWYDARSKGTAAAYYVINVPAAGSYLTNKDYIPFDKIDDFKVQEYTK